MSFDVFVFDLDFTIWDAGGTWCDATNPPYFWEDGKLYDQTGRWIRLYPDVLEIMNDLKRNNKCIVAASRTYEPEWAKDLLHLFNISDFFEAKEIYPDSKVTHFKRIQNFLKIPYSQMVFFDDEYRNIDAVSKLGVEAVLVQNGINKKIIQNYI